MSVDSASEDVDISSLLSDHFAGATVLANVQDHGDIRSFDRVTSLGLSLIHI